MQEYLHQLLTDITEASQNISWPFAEKELQPGDWISDEDEDKIPPIRNLEEWTGIKQVMLPPEKMLNDKQVLQLLDALKKLLNACNWSFVVQFNVPERIQYETIRQNFQQEVKMKRWHMGFFDVCKPGTKHRSCALGAYCHCAFFAEMFKDMVEEELSPEEERARALEIEVNHIRKKYGDDWMKYYPYHLDKNHDDENGEPYDYGFGEDEEDEDDDNWWRK